MKFLLTTILSVFTLVVFSQQDTIKLNFLYGSVPGKGYKKEEAKRFGGIKGGHVNIEANGRVLDFRPFGNCRVFPKNSKPNGGFELNKAVKWDTASDKFITILIPLTPLQMHLLDSLFDHYAKQAPYDYAVFGMRCAAASYDVLSEIGLFKELSNKENIVQHFYPKLLRKKMFKWARKNNYPILEHSGRNTRKWESDKGIL
ncbi:MAG: hypothetical protein H7Y42_19655 [Chitinophagaceae bacterium]|nr:hypothetical protein [Chitinophagaceae bacterium]